MDVAQEMESMDHVASCVVMDVAWKTLLVVDQEMESMDHMASCVVQLVVEMSLVQEATGVVGVV